MGYQHRQLLVGASDWTIAYTAAAEPPASSPAWTLGGTDHATASGGALAIASCGTDTNTYTKSLTDGKSVLVAVRVSAAAALATTEVWTLAKVQVRPVGQTTGAGFTLTHAANVLRLKGAADHAITGATANEDANYIVYYDYTAATVELWQMLPGGGMRALAAVAAETYAGPLGQSQAVFGKSSATSDNTSVSWRHVHVLEMATRDFHVFDSLPKGWLENDIETEKKESVAADGTTETIHFRDDRFFAWTAQALSSDDATNLRTAYVNAFSDGRTLLLYDNAGDIEGTEHDVIWAGKECKFRLSAANVPRYDTAIRLRVV